MRKKRLRYSRILSFFVSYVDESNSAGILFRKKHGSSEIKQTTPENLQDPSSIRVHSLQGTQTTVDSRPSIQKKRKHRSESDKESASQGDLASPLSLMTDSPQKDESPMERIRTAERSHPGIQENEYLDSMEEKNNVLFQSPLDTDYLKPREFVSISVRVKSVEPISAHMEVNVSLPTTMWCEGVLRGNQIHPGSVRSSREGLLVTSRDEGKRERKTLPLSEFLDWSRTPITTSTVLVLLSTERSRSRCSVQ